MLSSRQTYGAPRVHADAAWLGERHSRKRIARLMREAGLVGASHRRGGPITTRRDKDARPAPDLVDRDFSAPRRQTSSGSPTSPTCRPRGFLYLAVVIDAFSRRVVGWAMANHLRAELVLDALEMALASGGRGRHPPHRSGQPIHLVAFGKRCREAGVRPSMGSVGDAYDNALAERFFATWKASCSSAAGSPRKPRPAWPASASSRASTTAHQNAHLAMLLMQRGFAARGPVPWGVWRGLPPAERGLGRPGSRERLG